MLSALTSGQLAVNSPPLTLALSPQRVERGSGKQLIQQNQNIEYPPASPEGSRPSPPRLARMAGVVAGGSNSRIKNRRNF